MKSSMRLERTLNHLKHELRNCGTEWSRTQDKELLTEIHALVGAINGMEEIMFNRRITTLMDCI